FYLINKPCALIYVTKDAAGNRSQEFRTLFLQEMINRGIVCPNLIVSAAHTDADIDRTIEAVGESLEVYKRALEDGVERYLEGRPVKLVAREYNGRVRRGGRLAPVAAAQRAARRRARGGRRSRNQRSSHAARRAGP